MPVITVAVGEESKKETTKKDREKNRKNFVRAASELFQLIMAPFEKAIKTRNLIIVPHGALHKVPFSTLSDAQRYMIDKYAISVLPAASVIEHVVKKRKAEQERLVVFANPKTDYIPLEFAEIEGKTISKLFPKMKFIPEKRQRRPLPRRRLHLLISPISPLTGSLTTVSPCNLDYSWPKTRKMTATFRSMRYSEWI